MLDPLSLPRLEGIMAFAREHGWALIHEDRLPPGGIDRIDGALVSLRGRPDQLARVKELQDRGKPIVDLTVACPEIRLPRVVSDHKALGALAAQHFIDRGFQHFAWYASGQSHVHDLRYQGYATVLRKRRLGVQTLTNLADLAALPRPLAVLAFDESDAARLIDSCMALRLDVPGDVSVLGIGNDPFLCENGNLAISSVDQNLTLAAREACSLLERLMGAPAARRARPSQCPLKLIPPGSVISRTSTDTLAHSDPTLRAALVYIHNNLHRPFGAAETAEAIGVPRSTLDHLFTEKLRHSIGREILNQRLQRAKHLLRDDSVQLGRIAEVCGFCNASYFTNVFRRETGITPKDWRKRNITLQAPVRARSRAEGITSTRHS